MIRLKGKYDMPLFNALGQSRATEGLFMVVDGYNGPGFCGQVKEENLKRVITALRNMAAVLESKQINLKAGLPTE